MVLKLSLFWGNPGITEHIEIYSHKSKLVTGGDVQNLFYILIRITTSVLFGSENSCSWLNEGGITRFG